MPLASTSTPPVSTAITPRLWFVDWLRIGAFGLLVLYHVGMVYVPWDFHVKASPTWPALQPWMRLTNPWRMGLLFAIAGIATAAMLARPTGASGLAKDRSQRLLLPLIFGMLVIVVPQAWFEVRQRFGFSGGGFCDQRGCLILPTWNHLWFLPYLWLYTMVALGLRRAGIGPAALRLADRICGWIGTQNAPGTINPTATSPRAMLPLAAVVLGLPVLWLALIRIVLLPRFPETHAFADDPMAHLVYGTLFAVGLLLGTRPALFGMLDRLRWPALVLALAAWALMMLAYDQGLHPKTVSEPVRQLWMLGYATQQWCATVAAFGFASRHWNVDHRWRAPLNEAVYPLYLLHQTVIIFAVVMLWPLGLPVVLEAAITVMAAFAAGLIGWQLARRIRWLAPWMGLRPAK